MTVSQLHALYCAAHSEARRLSDGGVAGAQDLQVVDDAGLTQLERVILEFALHDVSNGRPMRTRREFEQAVEQGAGLLRSLGLRAGPDAPGPARRAAGWGAAVWRRRDRHKPHSFLEVG